MIRTIAFVAATLAPFSALAHTDGHAEMSLTSELAHIVSDPVHLAVVAGIVVAGAAVWFGLRTKEKQAVRAQNTQG